MQMLKGRLILVVDDDHDICLVVGKMLHNHGAVVLKAGTITEALECLHQFDCELIITDLNMPGGGGKALLGTKVPSVAMSGALDAYLARGGGGFDGSISKPFDEDELLEVIMSCIVPLSMH